VKSHFLSQPLAIGVDGSADVAVWIGAQWASSTFDLPCIKCVFNG